MFAKYGSHVNTSEFVISGLAGVGTTTTTPIGGFNQNKAYPATVSKLKAEKRQRKVLHGQNYLKLRGKY